MEPEPCCPSPTWAARRGIRMTISQTNLPSMADLPTLLANKGAGLNQDQSSTLASVASEWLKTRPTLTTTRSRSTCTGKSPKTFSCRQATPTRRRWMQPPANGSGGDLEQRDEPLRWMAVRLRARRIYDRNNVLFFNFVYDIPLFKNGSRLLKATLGGWALSGIITAESGAPLNMGVNGTTSVQRAFQHFKSSRCKRVDLLSENCCLMVQSGGLLGPRLHHRRFRRGLLRQPWA